jgi:DNA-binding response OmpR family regulator
MNSVQPSASLLPSAEPAWGGTAPRARMLLLVIDPDPAAAALLDGVDGRLDIRICATGAEGLLMAGAMRPDVVLMRADLSDVPAPVVVDLLGRCELPVIVAVDGEHSDLAGAALEAGAVAVVARPYRPAQLMPLVSALRPHPAADDGDLLRCGPVELSPGARTVRVHGALTTLPPQEFRLLHFLLTHEGRVVSQAQLWHAVWGGSAPSTSNTVSVHMRRLRRRLGDAPGHPRLITTVGRSGYLLQAPPE